jgi:hypothetical protein
MYLKDWQADHANSPAKKKVGVTSEVTSTPTPLYGNVVKALARHTTHNMIVLMPNAGDDALRHRINAVTYANDMWMVEGDLKRYERIMREYMEIAQYKTLGRHNFNLDTVWFTPFLRWCEEFDPNGQQVDAAVLNSAPNLAAAELVRAWPFVRPHGSITAVLPASELFEEQEMHDWLEERWADYEFIDPGCYDAKYRPLQLCSVYLTRCYSIETGELM